MYPIIGYLGFGNSNYSTGFGSVYEYWVLGPLGPYNPHTAGTHAERAYG